VTPRLAVVVVLVVAFGLARLRWQGRRARLAADDRAVPDLPATLRGEASRTWVVFTTPTCASCGPVTEHLRAADPDAAIVTVDATEEPGLADAYRVRSAPTVFLADRSGRVNRRLVGAAAVYGVKRP